MAALSATSVSQRSIHGDLDYQVYALSGNNGDTFTPPQKSIRQVIPVPTTAIAIGYTLAGNTITFVTLGAWAAQVGIFSRIG